jgi:DNA polymerase-3 subunit epsilon
MNCVAVDFETANRRRSSACALGVVLVEDSQIIDSKEWLFRPYGSKVDRRYSRIHGIDTGTLADCPQLPDLWSGIRPYFEGKHVIAHYAAFDVSVLRRSLAAFGISCPSFEYTCTWLVAKRTWPAFRTFGLAHLAKRLGIDVNHHNALSDALASLAILQAACRVRDASSIAALEAGLNLARGHVSPGMQTLPPSRGHAWSG